MALSEKQLEQRRNAGKARAAQFTPEYQSACGKLGYTATLNGKFKGDRVAMMRFLAEQIAKRPLTEPECRTLDILYGMGLDPHTSYIVETESGAWAVDAYIESAHLIIQVDGEYWHDMPGRHERDLAVDENIRAAGYRICRMPAHIVLLDPELAHAIIERALGLDKS